MRWTTALFFIYLVISISFFPVILFSQSPFNAGVLAGLTTTQIDGDGYSGFDKAGFTFGGFVNNSFGAEKWSGQLELLYVQKGSRRPPNLEKGITLYQINLTYIEVPVLAKLRYRRINYEAGLSFGRLIRHREFDMSGEIFNRPMFRKNEIAFDAALGIDLTDKIYFNARFIRSILPVRDYTILARYGFFGFIGGSYNTVLSYTIRYQFGANGKNSPAREKKAGEVINKILKIEDEK